MSKAWHSIGILVGALCMSGQAGGQTAQAAEKQKVAIVRVEFAGGAPESVKGVLTRRLVDGLTAVAFDVLGGGLAGDRMVDGATASSCHNEACYPRVASALGAAYLVTVHVLEQQKSYVLNLELVNGNNGQVVGSNRERCEICGMDEVGEKMSLAAAALRSRLEALVRAPSRFVVRTRPEGARVLLDGKPVGQTPMELTLTAGAHKLRLHMEGYDAAERDLTTVSGVDENLELDLLRLPTKFPFVAAGWGAIAASAIAVGVGTVLILTDGNEIDCEKKDARGHCPEIWKHGSLGAGVLGLGAALGTLGGVWLYLAAPSGPSTSRETAVRAGWTGRF